MSGTVGVTVDGRPLRAEPGQTIAAVLLSAGLTGGVFCGIGVCFGCLVQVNGVSDVRACQRVAVDGDDVRTVRP